MGTYGGSKWWNRTAHFTALKKREIGRSQVPNIPFKRMSPVIEPPPTRPHVLKFHQLLIAPEAGSQSL
jgi:hypothetical protein